MDILFVLVIIGLTALYMVSTFVNIPINHLVMVEVSGRPIHIMGHLKDVDAIKKAIELLQDSDQKERLTDAANSIKIRESFWDNPLTFWMVTLFNLHFKHWNPFARLRTVKVSRTKENPKYDPQKGISGAIYNEDEDDGDKKDYKETPYLRIRIRRVGVSLSRELMNDVGIDLYWLATEFTIVDPWYAYVTSPNPTLDLDNQITGAWNNLCSCLTYEQFQKLDTGGKADNGVNKYFKEIPELFAPDSEKIVAGIKSIGMILTGTISIGDYGLSGDQVKVKEAKARQAAAQAHLAAAELEAKALAAKIIEEGKATAGAIREKGAAAGQAAEDLRKGIADDPLTAKVLETQAYGGNVTTVINGTTPGVILPIPTPTPKNKP